MCNYHSTENCLLSTNIFLKIHHYDCMFLYKIEHEINETSNVGQFMGMSDPWFVDHHLRSLSESICPIVLCRLVYTCENLQCNYCLQIDLYYSKCTHQRTATTLSIIGTPWRIENCGKGASEFVFKLFSMISCLKQEAYRPHQEITLWIFPLHNSKIIFLWHFLFG